MQALRHHRPAMATVLDLEQKEQLPEVLSWAEEAAQYIEMVVIIPKVFGIIPSIPEQIGGAQVILGYSVPTRYGGTEVPLWEFSGWPVHLLGGSPKKQKILAKYLHVVSVDGNYANLKATKFCMWFDGVKWSQLMRGDEIWGKDAPYEAFQRSCQGIMQMWSPANNSLHRSAADARKN